MLRPTTTYRTTTMLARGYSAAAGKIGVIGLGQMGGHMARNLAAAGNHLVVFDVVDANVQAAKAHGKVEAAATPRDVAKQCHTIVTMLPSTPHVSDVYLGPHGLIHELTKDHLLIDSSTIDPTFTKTLSATISETGALIIDAPVSGGVNGAKNATLTFMVGGSKPAFDKAQTVLKQMGKNIVHCGGPSTGQAAKICNNLALAIQMTSVAEALTLGEKLGLDPKVLSSIMNTSTSQCWSTTANNPYPGVMEGVPSSNDYNGGFASVLMRKDLGLAIDAAKSVEASIPLTSSVHQFYNMIVNQGNGKKDFGYILKFLQGKA
ncbi:3-hydroxyisobutyrate dehydrogenase [Saprolegnia parasitica CBS 223.65]|uniref:3-hydroxyisobutyrate dehydrogenase n=1 Tax=Saprolegnia parasitica (strain CBS 223.65) TaxID=695850 RepID=A0A067CG49_SAPPC|nr:3-hydroxyisobutyrate dehydrogenase [Saprolegnia parasitica CBS 223.65]KDO25782.1 3-hydroxyisobutyrate dehydrogenase [Saprolegnia parasitica CBS 223.65]|eukprot:XP_012203586.1 3-hydroxyisobutyrate dehydrogenase [Saprolegnia parasitica CBS 223.65]